MITTLLLAVLLLAVNALYVCGVVMFIMRITHFSRNNADPIAAIRLTKPKTPSQPTNPFQAVDQENDWLSRG
jgi:hypothetical protein